MNTWTDTDGHPWPVTGDWCQACGRPLIRVDQPTHPTCDPAPSTSAPLPMRKAA